MLNFGKYGFYVWSTYLITVFALIFMAVSARGAANRELKSALRRNQASQSKQPNGGN